MLTPSVNFFIAAAPVRMSKSYDGLANAASPASPPTSPVPRSSSRRARDLTTIDDSVRDEVEARSPSPVCLVTAAPREDGPGDRPASSIPVRPRAATHRFVLFITNRRC